MTTTSASIVQISSGSNTVSPLAINNNGQVLLVTSHLNSTEASASTVDFSLWQNGTTTDIGTFSGEYLAGALNDSGTVILRIAVFANSGIGTLSSYVWQNGTASQAGTFEGNTPQFMALDNSNRIYGNSVGSGLAPNFVYQNGAFTPLNANLTLSGLTQPLQITATNAQGDLVGVGSTGPATADLWKNGQFTNLGDTGSNYVSAIPRAINASDEVVGNEQSAYGISPGPAFLWRNGKMIELATFNSAYTYNYAVAINDQGLIVGSTSSTYSSSTPVLWQNDTITDLNSLLPANSGWVLETVTGINDHNQIVGIGTYNGTTAAYELTLPTLTYSAATVASEQSKGLVSSVTAVNDSAANVSANLDTLQQVASAGELGTITLTDSGTPALTLSVAQITSDAAVLKAISGPYTLAVTDTAANVAADLDSLQALVTAKTLSSITLTDSGIPTLSLTAAQLSADAGALADISGNYTISVTAPASGSTSIAGIAGHGTVISFSGTAASYTIAASGDGSSLTVGSDHLSNVTALQFSDHLLFVASTTPATAGAVSSAEVANLYAGVFARTPDTPGLAYYEAQAAANPSRTITSFAESFLSSPEYTNAHSYAQTPAGDAQFITDTYQNLLHRAPGSTDVAWYQANVINPILGTAAPGTAAYTQAELLAHAAVLADFSQSAEFLGDVQVTTQHPADAQHWLILV